MFSIFKKKRKKQGPPFWPPLLPDGYEFKENGLMAHLADKESYIETPDGYTWEPPSRLQKIKMWVRRMLAFKSNEYVRRNP